jgi:pSer/pThr/pTyr-binding forkhead associated (FHA) protein
MPWRCPVCGTENRDDALTCRVCGAYKPEATTRQVAQIAKESVSATLHIEILESHVESLVGRRFEIKVTTPGTIVSVGRAVENQIVVPDPTVSRRHLRLIVTSNGIIVEDLGSTNGTYLVERGVERLIKVENVGREAVVRIGGTKLRITLSA